MAHKYDAAQQGSQGAVNIQSNTLKTVTCAVVGARGYSGLELVGWLLKHPLVKLTEAYASKSFPLHLEVEDPAVADIRVAGEDQVLQTSADVVFLATPAEVSVELAPKLAALGKKVIDLSGAFRLQKHAVKDWYSFDVGPELLRNAHYGLVPFAGPVKSAAGMLISNPGCYATAVQMALVPLLKRGLIASDMLVVDAKSGTSGAGRKAQEGLLFTEVAEDIRPYRVGKHQHQPEILEGLENFAGAKPELFFSTHLLPVRHGILASIYAKAKTSSLQQIEDAYAEAFVNYPLAKWGRLEEKPQLAKLTKVVGTPETRISFELRDGKLFVFSCIDNRLKGAATQAIENLNMWLDWPVHTGLLTHPVQTGPAGSRNINHPKKEV